MINFEIDLLQKIIKNIGRNIDCSQFIDNVPKKSAIDYDKYVKEKIATEIGLKLLEERKIEFTEDNFTNGKVIRARFRYIPIKNLINFMKKND